MIKDFMKRIIASSDSETENNAGNRALQVLHEESRTLVMEAYSRLPQAPNNHAAGAFSTEVLKRIEQILPAAIEASAETGCGKSTVLFSNLAKRHKVFSLDDRSHPDSSVNFFQNCPLTKNEGIELIFGPTQQTLLPYSNHEIYDAVLIDGPHGYPFPEMEYFCFYPHIREGGYLIIDDVSIPTIGRLADFLVEDEMFDLVETISSTAVFRRTAAPTFDPLGDGWWTQRYNRRRISPRREIFLADGPVVDAFSSQALDRKLMS